MITKHKAGMGKRIAMLGILAGLGLIAFLLESLIPLPYLPGAKLGLANIFSMLALALYGLPDALVIVFARTFLGSLFAGNISMILYSMTAGVVSVCACRCMLYLVPHISFVAVNVAGAVLHNLVQLIVYCALAGTIQLLGYAPYLCLLGALSGAAIGLAVTYTLKLLPARILPQEKSKGGIK